MLKSKKEPKNEMLSKNDDFKKEANLLNKCYHPNIVKLLGICQYQNSSNLKYLIMEFMNLGDLKKYLEINRSNRVFVLL